MTNIWSRANQIYLPVRMGTWETADVGPMQQVVQAGDGGQHVLLHSSRPSSDMHEGFVLLRGEGRSLPTPTDN